MNFSTLSMQQSYLRFLMHRVRYWAKPESDNNILKPLQTVYMTSPLKQRVLETADRLFYAEGVRAIGVDRIIEESAIAKASFYRFFSSKDVLIAEWLTMRDSAWRKWLEESVDMLAPDPANRPLAVFDAMYCRFRNPIFRGCAFMNTIVELARDTHPATVVARDHKETVIALIEKYLVEAGHHSAKELSVVFMQLIDGAIITAVREGKPDSALRAKEMASMLLSAQRSSRAPDSNLVQAVMQHAN
jgi:AcrR family transcriptional regulator